MKRINYFDFGLIFSRVYLEDSFVIKIIEKTNLLSFEIEFVLTENNPLYHKPKKGEQYCYRKGYLNFINPSTIKWIDNNLNIAKSMDINNEIDYGNIDSLFKENNFYFIEGSWGKIMVSCEDIKIRL